MPLAPIKPLPEYTNTNTTPKQSLQQYIDSKGGIQGGNVVIDIDAGDYPDKSTGDTPPPGSENFVLNWSNLAPTRQRNYAYWALAFLLIGAGWWWWQQKNSK